MRLRFTAAAAAVASIVVFALSIVLLVAGSSPSQSNDNYWVALNTSGVGSTLVTVSPATSGSSSGLGSIISAIPGLDSILNNITQEIGSGLSDVQGEVIGALVRAIGLKDYYFLYTSKMCEASLRSNDSNSGLIVDSCYSYHDGGVGLMNVTNSIPNSFTIANTQVSVPVVHSLQSSLENILGLIVGTSTTLMVLLIITCIGSGITAIGSVLGIIRPKATLLVYINLGSSSVAATAISVLTLTLTGLVFSTANMINSFGSGLSLNVKTGTSFIAIIWVATVLATIANLYWLVVWFVEFRKSAFSRRSRTKNQIGNWWGIFGEVRRDIRLDGHFPPPDEYGERGGPNPSKEKRPKEQETGGGLSVTTL